MSASKIVTAATNLVDAWHAFEGIEAQSAPGIDRAIHRRIDAEQALEQAVNEYRADCAPREWTLEEVMRREA